MTEDTQVSTEYMDSGVRKKSKVVSDREVVYNGGIEDLKCQAVDYV